MLFYSNVAYIKHALNKVSNNNKAFIIVIYYHNINNWILTLILPFLVIVYFMFGNIVCKHNYANMVAYFKMNSTTLPLRFF